MRLQSVLSLFVLAASAAASNFRGFGEVGAQYEKLLAERAAAVKQPPVHRHQQERRQSGEKAFLTAKTEKFAVDGTKIPDVDFDVGESYAGLMPISNNTDEKNNLFFWFFPSTNPDAKKEITIWLNGGPGCSSFEGLIQENGPFLWQWGTYRPVANPWSWHHLTNMIYVDQPVGTGYATGTPTITNQEELAAQFMGFWKNFVDAFEMQGYKVYISGESYAGRYCPYIAKGMLDANDKNYYDMKGMLIYNPTLTHYAVHQAYPLVQFVEYWTGLFPFNDTFRADIKAIDAECGFSKFVGEHLVYPSKGKMSTSSLPAVDPATGQLSSDKCASLYYRILQAIMQMNPCFDLYHVSSQCPLPWDILGYPGSTKYSPSGASIYFDRKDVKEALHAPVDVKWEQCKDNVFVDDKDDSEPSSFNAVPSVIDRTQNVIISHGALDMILIANGTLLAIQNMTWGGKTGFDQKPSWPFYVPAFSPNITTLESLAVGGSVFGSMVTERGLTYVGVDLAGHMVPQYAPSAAYRQMEYLLGRVNCMNCTKPFTTDPNGDAAVDLQSMEELGTGTAPQGWSNLDALSVVSTNAGGVVGGVEQAAASPRLLGRAWEGYLPSLAFAIIGVVNVLGQVEMV